MPNRCSERRPATCSLSTAPPQLRSAAVHTCHAARQVLHASHSFSYAHGTGTPQCRGTINTAGCRFTPSCSCCGWTSSLLLPALQLPCCWCAPARCCGHPRFHGRQLAQAHSLPHPRLPWPWPNGCCCGWGQRHVRPPAAQTCVQLAPRAPHRPLPPLPTLQAPPPQSARALLHPIPGAPRSQSAGGWQSCGGGRDGRLPASRPRTQPPPPHAAVG